MTERFITIHGHFYQPPRENPWLEAIELQDSAYPYHDWNDRITAECYAPNASARILDGEGRIASIVNNYARISFNFGPTLLSWMEIHNPGVYQAILEADKESQGLFSGHGSAMAQVYNHMIMPLSNRRDKETQILWGIRDFEHRFGRRPEGIWLAETAVDLETLDLLADQGIRFTVLSPYQAGDVRPLDNGEWQDARGARIDPTRAYLQRLPSGNTIILFFYDAPVSQAVAFEKLLVKGETFANRLLSAFADDRDHPQLAHIATDGESYGHHSAHGDMALAYALHFIENEGHAKLTNYGEYLETHPPTHEVNIVENTSWSCIHGIERWRSDCGCNSGRIGWHQEWRAPLRMALDWLRDTIAPTYEKHAAEFLKDPWTARNDYIAVILDRSPESIDRFFDEHCRRHLTDAERTRALELLELQRQAMLMYTSCGWFFDDISGIETVQIIMYAGRAIQLVEYLFGDPLEAKFLELLEKAKSNIPEHRDGKHIYEKWVKPAIVDWMKVGAHFAISSLFESMPETAEIYCFTFQSREHESHEAGKAKLGIGQVDVSSKITLEKRELSYGFLHFGDHNVAGGVSERLSSEQYDEVREGIVAAFNRGDFPAIVRQIDQCFGGAAYTLKSAFRDEQRLVINRVLDTALGTAEETYRRLHDDNLPAMRFLIDMGMPLPRAFRMAAEFIVNTDLRRGLENEVPDIEQIQKLLSEGKFWDVPVDEEGVAFRLREALTRLAEQFRENPDHPDLLESLRDATNLAHKLGFEVDLWEPQNIFWRMLQHAFADFQTKARKGEENALAWVNRFIALGDQLGVQTAELKKKVEEVERAPTLPRIVDQVFEQSRVPDASYRVQFNADFTFGDALGIVDYLHDLGISDFYASPLKRARKGSPHGYDITDHDQLNPVLGTTADFEALSEALNERGMGMILDTVPNHMGIGDTSNRWWMDVLENGSSSIFADYFDIDWDPVNPSLENRVLLPILEDQYGKVLESGKLRLEYSEGTFTFHYYEMVFPVAPGSYALILEHTLERLVQRLGEDHDLVKNLQSILTAIHYLPSRTEDSEEKLEERNREKEIIKSRIATLEEESKRFQTELQTTVTRFNGQPGSPESFDLLDRLLMEQAYRPAFWRVATEEINYRRFFDVNELAAIRIEKPEVFEATHRLIFEEISKGQATGLRIDHPDGLWNPTAYFRQLQEEFIFDRVRQALAEGDLPEDFKEEVRARIASRAETSTKPTIWPLYVVAEKILAEGEPLPADWDVAGTTGYDFLNAVNGIFVACENVEAFDEIYAEFIGRSPDFTQLVSSSKKMVMLISMASEINSLSHQLDRISERNRRYRDFTHNSLTFAIREIIAYLPIYRTYISGVEGVALRDRMYIEEAVEEAKQRNPRTAEAIFDFVRDVLLLRNIEDFHVDDRPRLVEWAMKFQQLSGPVMAKGVEDTVFYLYNRLVSLNEVGGHPDHFGASLTAFHVQNTERYEQWPHSMLSSSTHDTKRSEDVRARINVLSEIPQQWSETVEKWRKLNVTKKTPVENESAPSPNDEYLLYQTLVGAWPCEPWTPEVHESFQQRITDYMRKATKEGKDRTSWINPNLEYDRALSDFIDRLLQQDADDEFFQSMVGFQSRISYFGYFNSLSQLLLKLTAPGVPDTYQGTELWDFSLVDPDNRRFVDYDQRKALLSELKEEVYKRQGNLVPYLHKLLENIVDGRIKLFVLWTMLKFRREHQSLFSEGNYLALEAVGEKKEHVCAFQREQEDEGMLVVVPRLVYGLCGGEQCPPTGSDIWGETRLLLPVGTGGRKYRNLFSGEVLETKSTRDRVSLALGKVLNSFPLAVLYRVE